MPNVRTLLDFIAQPESGGDYNIVWGGISKNDRPPKPLVTMTIGEVLAWQDSIDAKYMSEASGRYQIMEDTLRTLYPQAGLRASNLFDEEGQDVLATALLIRRGLNEYLAGKITTEAFANSLAREWASLPVVSGRKKGQSYYAGDGLNKSHVSVDAFLRAVESVRGAAPADTIVFKAKERVLRYGDFGDRVGALQAALNRAGYPVDIDKDFGPQTQSAVLAFQEDSGLDADGKVGEMTWDYLRSDRRVAARAPVMTPDIIAHTEPEAEPQPKSPMQSTTIRAAIGAATANGGLLFTGWSGMTDTDKMIAAGLTVFVMGCAMWIFSERIKKMLNYHI